MQRRGQSSSLAAGIRRRRIAAGLTQADLAHAIKGADATISRIERARMAPSQGMLESIAAALGCSVSELYERPRVISQRGSLRPSQVRLVALSRNMTDAQVDDLVRAIKSLLRLGRSAKAP